MYFIIEIQVNNEGVGSALVTTKEDRNQAESEFHRILQYAAISELPRHGALIVTDRSELMMSGYYEHTQEIEQE